MRTQLCLGLAAVAVHVPAERWGEAGVIRWFGFKFGAVGADVALPCMLELLTVLPQVGRQLAPQQGWGTCRMPHTHHTHAATATVACLR